MHILELDIYPLWLPNTEPQFIFRLHWAQIKRSEQISGPNVWYIGKGKPQDTSGSKFSLQAEPKQRAVNFIDAPCIMQIEKRLNTSARPFLKLFLAEKGVL